MKLIVGTANFQRRYGIRKNKIQNIHEIKKIIKYSVKNKIDSFDLAYSYISDPKILNELSKTKLNLISKISIKDLKFSKNFKLVYENLKNYLKKTKYSVQTLLFHDIKDFKIKKNRDTIIKLLYCLKKDKLVNKIGISVYKPNDLEYFLKFMTPDVVQIPMNPLNTEFYDDGLLYRLRKKRVKIHVRSIFLQGLLLDYNKKSLPKNFKKEVQHIIKWNHFCKNKNISSLEGCLQFIRNFKEIDALVLGIDSLQHLKDIKYLLSKNKIQIKFLKKIKKNSLLLDPRKWKR